MSGAHSIWAYPWDLFDLGAERACGQLADLGPEWKRLRDAAQREALAQREARAQAEASTTLARDQARHTRASMLHAQRLQRALPANEPSPPGLFARSVGPVHLLRGGGLAELDLPRPPPIARQRALDEQAALAQSMSDEVNLESLLLTDDGLSFRRPGVGTDVLTKLRRGVWALQGQIDLHGCKRDEDRELLAGYIHDSHRRGLRCLRVVHGKGHGSPGRHNGRDLDVLLKLEVSIDSEETIEFGRSEQQQLPVLNAGPACLNDGADYVRSQLGAKPPRNALVKQHAHVVALDRLPVEALPRLPRVEPPESRLKTGPTSRRPQGNQGGFGTARAYPPGRGCRPLCPCC